MDTPISYPNASGLNAPVEVGQRVRYYHYTTTYGYADDRTETAEQIRCGQVVSVHDRFVKVRSDASGLVVNVLHHRILK